MLYIRRMTTYTAAHKAYYQKNKDKLNGCNQEYYQAHKETIRAQAKARRLRRSEEYKKVKTEWRKGTVAQRRVKRLKREYGITQEQFLEMLKAQDGKCAICKTENPGRCWNIDHNHRTGKVRAILCGKCNTALGLFKENRESLIAALAYLDRYT